MPWGLLAVYAYILVNAALAFALRGKSAQTD